MFDEFRSDTFTLPDEGMRRAIYQAEVGNSVYGEDPSVNELEQAVAQYFGREAALFFPSATMAGQSAIAVWCKPAEIVLIEEYGHNFYFETGSMAFISGTQARPLSGQHGILSSELLASSIVHVENPHARTGQIVLENTSNYGGGTVYPLPALDAIFDLGASMNCLFILMARGYLMPWSTTGKPTPPCDPNSYCRQRARYPCVFPRGWVRRWAPH